MAKFAPSRPPMLAWRTICTASSLCFMPEPEKMGSFWPRIRVVRHVDGGNAGVDVVARVDARDRVDGHAVDVHPAFRENLAQVRRSGGRRRRRRGPASRGTGAAPWDGPVRRVRVFFSEMPAVPSNTWITARSPSICTTRPSAGGRRSPDGAPPFPQSRRRARRRAPPGDR